MDIYDTINKTIDYIEDNLKEDLKIEQICKEANYSISRYSTIFKAVVGLNLHEYVRKRRLTEIAKDYISAKSFSYMCSNYGYYSQTTMNEEFEEEFGISMGTYKKTNSKIELFERVSVDKDKCLSKRIMSAAINLEKLGIFSRLRITNHGLNYRAEVNPNKTVRALRTLQPFMIPKKEYYKLSNLKDLINTCLLYEYLFASECIDFDEIEIEKIEYKVINRDDQNNINGNNGLSSTEHMLFVESYWFARDNYDFQNPYILGDFVYFFFNNQVKGIIQTLKSMNTYSAVREHFEFRTIWYRQYMLSANNTITIPRELAFSLDGYGELASLITPLETLILCLLIEIEQGFSTINTIRELCIKLKSLSGTLVLDKVCGKCVYIDECKPFANKLNSKTYINCNSLNPQSLNEAIESLFEKRLIYESSI